MINISRDDYILVQHKGTKPSFALVIDPKHHKASLELGAGNHSDDDMITYDPKSVIANFGQDPRPGKAFGITIEPFRSRITSKNFGEIDIYRKMEEPEFTALKKAMKSLYPKLEAHRCHITLPVRFVIRPAQGKYAGYFKMITRRKDNVILDHICLMPKIMTDVPYLEYVIAHETMHSLWFRAVPDDLKAKWLKLYRKRLSLVNIKKVTLESLGREIASYEGTVTDYMKEMADDETNSIIKEVLTWISKYHRLSKREIRLLQDYDNEALMDLWPTHAELAKGNNDPTEYAMKNVAEFFAECGALKVTGKKLSKDIQKGLAVTFKRMMFIPDVKGLDNDQDDD